MINYYFNEVGLPTIKVLTNGLNAAKKQIKAKKNAEKMWVTFALTSSSGGRNVSDIRMVVEAWRVVIDVWNRHWHRGRAGQALGLPSVSGHDQQLVISPVLSVQ